MNILLIAGIILALILIILVIKFLHSAVKTIILLLIILLIVFGVGAAVFIYDMVTFSRGLANNQNIFLLRDDNDIVAGFVTEGVNLAKSQPIDQNNLNEYEDFYQSENYSKILDNKYRLFVIDRTKLAEVNLKTEFIQKILDREELPEFLQDIEIDNIDETTSAGFTIKLIASMKRDPLFIVKNYRKDNIEIYPKSLTFKALDLLKK